MAERYGAWGPTTGQKTLEGREITMPNTSGDSVATAEANKAIVRRFIEEVQNNKDWEVYDELNDPDFVNLSAPPGVAPDRESGKQYLQAFAAGYPDARFTVDDMIAEGDRVATKKTFSGTNTGEFMGMRATGKTVTIQYVDILRIREGRITEHWNCIDTMNWMQQLGIAPT
jgi:steroid delta-isomerase-like uncharacterized protein